jgi:hypothetical protein
VDAFELDDVYEPDWDDLDWDEEYSDEELDARAESWFEDEAKDRRAIERHNVQQRFHRRVALGRGRVRNCVMHYAVRSPRSRAPRRVARRIRRTARAPTRPSDDPEPLAVACGGRVVRPRP